MIFYLLPPDVTVNLRQFNQCCVSRFKFFCNPDWNSDGYNEMEESLMPGTKLDKVGHFVLRCFCLNRPEVTDFILLKETELFSRRLNESEAIEIRKFCDKAHRDVSRIESFHETNVLTSNKEKPYFGSIVTLALKEIFYTLKQKQYCEHFKNRCGENFPFQAVSSMVKLREIEIRQGSASIPCSKWTKLLEELFVHHFKVGLSIISYSVMRSIHSDVRWQSIFQVLYDMYNCFLYRPPVRRTRILHQRIDLEKRHFPACMSHLLNVLRKNHRLTHIWRYYFSLFLKDIGLTLDDSIEFWKKEYSQSCSAETSCTHSWQQNERKYRYSIRHLYGLEGAKVEKTSKSCQHIQTMQLGMRDEGGCPFVHFDNLHLKSALCGTVRQDDSFIERIIELKNSGRPREACSLHMKLSSGFTFDDCKSNETLRFESPVDYYFCKKGYPNKSLEW